MTKKLLCLLLAVCVTLCATAALAQSAHEHVWGEWADSGDGATHTASCTAGDGATESAAHYNFTGTIAGTSVRVCGMCGACSTSAAPFALIAGATATPVGENPANQRGSLVVRGLESPFAEDASVLYAFTMAYEWNGGLATFKNRCELNVPLPEELPEGWKLIRISVASGDDSTQRSESWIDIEAAWENGVLTFESKTPSLFLILAGE